MITSSNNIGYTSRVNESKRARTLRHFMLSTVACSLFAVVPAINADQVTLLGSFVETFDDLTAGAVNGQNDWVGASAVGNAAEATVTSSKKLQLDAGQWASHAIPAASQAERIEFSWTMRSSSGSFDPFGGVSLMSGSDLTMGNSILFVGIERSNKYGGWSNYLVYTEWDKSSSTYVQQDVTSVTFARQADYTFSVDVNLESNTYSFTVSSGGSVTYTLDAIAINPNADTATFIKLQNTGTNASLGGHRDYFDNIKVETYGSSTVPEPTTTALVLGVLGLAAFVATRVRKTKSIS